MCPEHMAAPPQLKQLHDADFFRKSRRDDSVFPIFVLSELFFFAYNDNFEIPIIKQYAESLYLFIPVTRF
jgi:hypothetical protein